MSNRLSLYNMVIEITRRCNMDCSHCMRGEPESLDMPVVHLIELFKRVERISSITLTGGEPSLVPNRIFHVVELAKAYEVDIGSFYIATNGKKVSRDFIMAVMELYLYCSDNEASQVEISNDPYHDAQDLRAMGLLSQLRFVGNKYSGEVLRNFDEYLISEGNSGTGKEVEPDHIEVDGKEVSEGSLYLNCYGDIISGCDFSYESQRVKPEIKICKVSELSISAIRNWQRRNSHEQ